MNCSDVKCIFHTIFQFIYICNAWIFFTLTGDYSPEIILHLNEEMKIDGKMVTRVSLNRAVLTNMLKFKKGMYIDNVS